MNSFVVPPGGLAGFAQMTPASRAALSPGGARSTGRRRKRKSTKTRAKKSRARKSGGGRKMKFGSPAWRKKYKLGKKRK